VPRGSSHAADSCRHLYRARRRVSRRRGPPRAAAPVGRCLAGRQGRRHQSEGARPGTPHFSRAHPDGPIDPQTNGPQLLYGLRYHIHINTPEEDITFHDQVGYWLWEPATGLILQSVTIPRGQVLLAAGHAKPDDRTLSVAAKRGDTRYGICSTEFLEEAFRTTSYRCDITFNDDGSWTYVIQTELLVRGTDRPFDHRDTNTLKLVEAPTLNPLAIILNDRAGRK